MKLADNFLGFVYLFFCEQEQRLLFSILLEIFHLLYKN